VIVDLRHGIAVAESLETFSIGFDDLKVDRGEFLFQPGEEGGAKIETDGGIVVVNIEDLPSPVDDPGMCIGSVAFNSDPFIPVVKGVGALLGHNGFQPGVLPGRLIEMAMNGYEGISHLTSILAHEPVRMGIADFTVQLIS
jgi:hypothetical protein